MGVAIVLFVLLAASAVDSLPDDRKPGLLNLLDDGLARLKTAKCQDSDQAAAWNQFCDDVTPVVRTCPSNESSEFYQRHCEVYFVVSQIKDLPLRVFESQDTAVQAVQAIVAKVPAEPCGYSLDHYCRRDTSVCDRSITKAGVCRSAKDLCSKDIYRERCLRTAHLYLVTEMMTAYINNTDWPLVLNGSEPRKVEELSEEVSDQDDEKRSTRWIVELLCGGGVLVVAAIAAGLIFRYRKAREAREIRIEENGYRTLIGTSKQHGGRGGSGSTSEPNSSLSKGRSHLVSIDSPEKPCEIQQTLDSDSDDQLLCDDSDATHPSKEHHANPPSHRASQSDWTHDLEDPDEIQFNPARNLRLSFSNS